jgi:4-hydroxyphenylacetate decarboxylase small subunit
MPLPVPVPVPVPDSPRHLDCRNFAPLDVVKGLCHRTKERVLADDPACEALLRLPRCRHCASYEAGPEPHLGACSAAPSRPMTYPDLVALHCELFTEGGQA